MRNGFRCAVVALAVAGGLVTAGSAQAAPTWAPASSATIHPGVQTVTDGGQCTANFVYFDASDVYIGQAAHCSGTDGNTATDGCTSGSLPLGTKVDVDGASVSGTLAYNSWLAMQANGETDEETCAYNDLALVKLDPADVSKVNPSVPVFGGPSGVGTAQAGDQIYTYGNSSLRGGITQLSPKSGAVVERTPGGWSYSLYTVTPGIPGDSGSAFLNSQGQALGVLSTVAIAPLPASNGVGDVAKEVAYMRANGGPNAELALGTEVFRGPLLP